jgi:hypothetical protein
VANLVTQDVTGECEGSAVKKAKFVEGKFLPLTMAIKRKSTGPVPGHPKAKAVKSNGKEFNGKKSIVVKAKKVEKKVVRREEEEDDDDEFEGFGDDGRVNESDVSMEDVEDELDMSGTEGESDEDEEGEDEEDPKPKKKFDKPPKSGTPFAHQRTNLEDNEPSAHIAQRALAKERKMTRPNGTSPPPHPTNKSKQTPRSKETLGIPPPVQTIQSRTTSPSRPIIQYCNRRYSLSCLRTQRLAIRADSCQVRISRSANGHCGGIKGTVH